MSGQVYTESGSLLHVGAKIGGGGEGTVYQVIDQPDQALKIYHPRLRDAAHAEKLAAMLHNPPVDPMQALEHRAIAWPHSLAYADAQQRQFVGFLMPRIPGGSTVIWKLAQPEERRNICPAFSFRHLVTAGRNLATAVAAIHAAGHRIGDLNGQNVLVDSDALVALIDTDSFQVGTPDGRLFPCTVATEEYMAPELNGVSLETTPRTPAGDGFTLAVLLFQMLMQGFHPFYGVMKRPGDPPPIGDRMLQGLYAYGGGREISPQPRAPSLQLLPRPVSEAFHRAFVSGVHDPSRRPTAGDWVTLLDQLLDGLADCSRHPRIHAYPGHLTQCPWCQPEGSEYFPEVPGLQIRVPRKDPGSSLAERRQFLQSQIEMALSGGYLTPEGERRLQEVARSCGMESELQRALERELKRTGARRGQPASTATEPAVMAFEAPEVLFEAVRPHTGRHRLAVGYSNTGRGSLHATLHIEPPASPFSVSPVFLENNRGEVTVTVDSAQLGWDGAYRARLVADYNGRRPGASVEVPVRVQTTPDAVLVRWMQGQARWAQRAALVAAIGLGFYALARRQEPVQWLFQLLRFVPGAGAAPGAEPWMLPAALLQPQFWWQQASTACLVYWGLRAIRWLWRVVARRAGAPWLAGCLSLWLVASGVSLVSMFAGLYKAATGTRDAPLAALCLTITVPLLVQHLSTRLAFFRLHRWLSRGGWKRRIVAGLAVWSPGVLVAGGLALVVGLGGAPLPATLTGWQRLPTFPPVVDASAAHRGEIMEVSWPDGARVRTQRSCLALADPPQTLPKGTQVRVVDVAQHQMSAGPGDCAPTGWTHIEQGWVPSDTLSHAAG